MHSVVSSRNSEHVTDLTPADLPEWNLFGDVNVLCCPWVFLVLSVVLPHLAGHVLGATGDHLVHEADVVAPCDISNPITVLTKLCLCWLSTVIELPEVNFVIVSS